MSLNPASGDDSQVKLSALSAPCEASGGLRRLAALRRAKVLFQTLFRLPGFTWEYDVKMGKRARQMMQISTNRQGEKGETATMRRNPAGNGRLKPATIRPR